MGKEFGNLFSEAKKYIASGYNSPFRAFNLVGGYPVFMKSGKGSKIFDVNGKGYIDYSLAWGPMILGHTHPKIVSAIKNASKQGWCFGTPTEEETLFAKLIKEFFPSMELIRLTNSGTEAVMSAIRLARGYTKKEKIIIFEGCYHGHSNDTLVKIKNKQKILSSSGVLKSILKNTLIAEYNSISSVERLFNDNNDISAVLIEPIPTNMGVILPKNNFLIDLKKLCEKNSCLLIFDEVVTGFRASQGGAQKLYEVYPDITVLGKSLAGGLPVGAFGGKKEIMDCLSLDGGVYSAGTFSGNPMTVNCGIATLKELSNKKSYDSMIDNTKEFCKDIEDFIDKNRISAKINYIGTMFSIFFTNKKELSNYNDVIESDFKIFAKYFHYLLDNGIYISPSGEDTSFMSTTHSKKDIKYTKKIIKKFLHN